jgi:hypothetical protein
LAPEAVGFPAIARLVKEIHVIAEKRKELIYYEYQLELQRKRGREEKCRAEKQKVGVAKYFFQRPPPQANQQPAPIQLWAAGRRVPDWTAGPALLSGLFLQVAAAKEPMYDRQMALVTGEFLAVDHCHKLMRRIR